MLAKAPYYEVCWSRLGTTVGLGSHPDDYPWVYVVNHKVSPRLNWIALQLLPGHRGNHEPYPPVQYRGHLHMLVSSGELRCMRVCQCFDGMMNN